MRSRITVRANSRGAIARWSERRSQFIAVPLSDCVHIWPVALSVTMLIVVVVVTAPTGV